MLRTATPTVSVLTPTTRWRAANLQLLAAALADQTYGNVLEWVVIDATPCDDPVFDPIIGAILDSATRHRARLPFVRRVRYPPSAPQTIGAIRQYSNRHCSGEVIVCCDDDDIYFTTRVEHAVAMLFSSGLQIAGCSGMMLYHCGIDQTVRYCFKHKNHSTNNAMAYTRDYAATHAYDASARFAEERSFTNGFTEQMVQLSCELSLVQTGHSQNTYNKLNDILAAAHANNGISFLKPDSLPSELTDNLLQAHRRVNAQGLGLDDGRWAEFDMMVYTGPLAPRWAPAQGAAPHVLLEELHDLLSHLAASGVHIVAFSNVADPVVCNGVHYQPLSKFCLTTHTRCLVLEPKFGAQWPLLAMIRAHHSLRRVVLPTTASGGIKYVPEQAVACPKSLTLFAYGGEAVDAVRGIHEQRSAEADRQTLAVTSPRWLRSDVVKAACEGVVARSRAAAATDETIRVVGAERIRDDNVAVITACVRSILEGTPRAMVALHVSRKAAAAPVLAALRDFADAWPSRVEICDDVAAGSVFWRDVLLTASYYLGVGRDKPNVSRCMSEALALGCVPIVQERHAKFVTNDAVIIQEGVVDEDLANRCPLGDVATNHSDVLLSNQARTLHAWRRTVHP